MKRSVGQRPWSKVDLVLTAFSIVIQSIFVVVFIMKVSYCTGSSSYYHLFILVFIVKFIQPQDGSKTAPTMNRTFGQPLLQPSPDLSIRNPHSIHKS